LAVSGRSLRFVLSSWRFEALRLGELDPRELFSLLPSYLPFAPGAWDSFWTPTSDFILLMTHAARAEMEGSWNEPRFSMIRTFRPMLLAIIASRVTPGNTARACQEIFRTVSLQLAMIT
jgi:hypothetical protein